MKKQNKRQSLLSKFKRVPVLAAVAVLVVAGTSAGLVHADSIQQQIDQLNAQSDKAQSSVNDLQMQASSYQDAISKLQTEINSIQSAISSSETKQAQLKAQIDADQKTIDQQKQYLGDDLKAMYVDGTMTTVEMLATSKNLSDFVDAETYRGAVQTKIQNTMAEIASLQNKLEDQQTQVQQLLASQQQQQSRLASDQSQQAQLLSFNQNQQSDYNSQIKADQSKVSQLKAQQAAINNMYAQSVHVAASGGSGGACDIGQGNGGYPLTWCNAAQDSMLDSNGLLNRECTSFAYWYFTSVEGKSLSVSGDAGDWWETGHTAAGPADQTPSVGAIGIEPRNVAPHYSPFGHVMIVLALPGSTYRGTYVPSGDVLVMSMNEDEAGDFMYNLWPANTLYYLH